MNKLINALYLTSMFFTGFVCAGMTGVCLLLPVLAVLSGLGGGLTRDLAVLHVHPYLFTQNGFHDVCLILAGLVSAPVLKWDKHWGNTFDRVSRLIDTLVFPVYLTMGYTKAVGLGFPVPVALVSAVVTATGGGTLVFAILHRGKDLAERIPVTWKALAVSFAISYYVRILPEEAVQVALGILVLCLSEIKATKLPTFSLVGVSFGAYPIDCPQVSSLKHKFLESQKSIENLVKLLLKRCSSAFMPDERKGISIA